MKKYFISIFIFCASIGTGILNAMDPSIRDDNNNNNQPEKHPAETPVSDETNWFNRLPNQLISENILQYLDLTSKINFKRTSKKNKAATERINQKTGRKIGFTQEEEIVFNALQEITLKDTEYTFQNKNTQAYELFVNSQAPFSILYNFMSQGKYLKECFWAVQLCFEKNCINSGFVLLSRLINLKYEKALTFGLKKGSEWILKENYKDSEIGYTLLIQISNNFEVSQKIEKIACNCFLSENQINKHYGYLIFAWMLFPKDRGMAAALEIANTLMESESDHSLAVSFYGELVVKHFGTYDAFNALLKTKESKFLGIRLKSFKLLYEIALRGFKRSKIVEIAESLLQNKSNQAYTDLHKIIREFKK